MFAKSIVCPPMAKWNSGSYLLILCTGQSYDNTGNHSLYEFFMTVRYCVHAHATFCKTTHIAPCSHIRCRLLTSELWVIVICIYKSFSKHTNTRKVLPTFHSLDLHHVTFKPKHVLEELIWDDPGEQLCFSVFCWIMICWSAKPCVLCWK